MKFRHACLLLALFIPNLLAAQERISLSDGSVLNVFLVRPAQTSEQPAPLVILMGGGPGNASISRDTSMWLGSGFSARGWMVAVPISPNNRSFRGRDNNEKVAMLIETLRQRDYIADGKVLLAGISNGGMSALEIARRNPGNYLGVVAIPALSDSGTDNSALKDMPVYLRIGSEDQLGWADRFDETVASLEAAGVELDAEILYGAPHMFRMDWDTLEPWLAARRP